MFHSASIRRLALGTLCEEFLKPLRAQPSHYGLTAQQVTALFSNVEAIAALHEKMLQALKVRSLRHHGLDCFAKSMVQ